MKQQLKVIYNIAKVLQYIAIVLFALSAFAFLFIFGSAKMMIGVIGSLIFLGLFTFIQILILKAIKKQIEKLANDEELSYVVPVVLFIFNIATLILGVMYIYLLFLVYRYNNKQV